MKKIIIAGIVMPFFCVILATLPVFAQAPGLPSSPSQVPITGGLGFLLIGGGVYAIKKLWKHSK